MRLYLAHKMLQLNVTATYFFRLAHVAKFGRDVDVQWDVARYMATGEPPPYVQSYIREIQEKEKQDALQTLSGNN